jgi:hypothetical protein
MQARRPHHNCQHALRQRPGSVDCARLLSLRILHAHGHLCPFPAQPVVGPAAFTPGSRHSTIVTIVCLERSVRPVHGPPSTQHYSMNRNYYSEIKPWVVDYSRANSNENRGTTRKQRGRGQNPLRQKIVLARFHSVFTLENRAAGPFCPYCGDLCGGRIIGKQSGRAILDESRHHKIEIAQVPSDFADTMSAEDPSALTDWRNGVKRLIPAILSLAVGLPLAAVGVVVFAAQCDSVWHNRGSFALGRMLSSSLPCLGLGIVWTLSGLLYWEEKWQPALLLTIVGILIAIPLILGATLGFGHG